MIGSNNEDNKYKDGFTFQKLLNPLSVTWGAANGKGIFKNTNEKEVYSSLSIAIGILTAGVFHAIYGVIQGVSYLANRKVNQINSNKSVFNADIKNGTIHVESFQEQSILQQEDQDKLKKLKDSDLNQNNGVKEETKIEDSQKQSKLEFESNSAEFNKEKNTQSVLSCLETSMNMDYSYEGEAGFNLKDQTEILKKLLASNEETNSSYMDEVTECKSYFVYKISGKIANKDCGKLKDLNEALKDPLIKYLNLLANILVIRVGCPLVSKFSFNDQQEKIALMLEGIKGS